MIRRFDALGPDIFFELLRGKIQSKTDLVNNPYFTAFIEENQFSMRDAIHNLELQELNILVPNEYIGQIHME